ncbi:MAG: LysM peptidoglycan-binding domain-containing protein [Ktedonobacteraceae bacterium]|nr:LysM peptidoglycan-binding domain-containing protein [Ktedonobacteraceae bacterium]
MYYTQKLQGIIQRYTHSTVLITVLCILAGILGITALSPVPLAGAQARVVITQQHPTVQQMPLAPMGGSQADTLHRSTGMVVDLATQPITVPVTRNAPLNQTCPQGDQVHSVIAGETLSTIAASAGTDWAMLAAHNHLELPDQIQIGQTICITPNGSPLAANTMTTLSGQNVVAPPVAVQTNLFSYGQCTWWANERYFQMHGVHVPWTTNADAWQWTARAYDFGWHVSNRPTIGAIIDLQAGVQGAGSLGHVGVVERILANGDVIASNMNWGATPGSVTNVQFTPGPMVTFLTQ